jgi:hypothetical protein
VAMGDRQVFRLLVMGKSYRRACRMSMPGRVLEAAQPVVAADGPLRGPPLTRSVSWRAEPVAAGRPC